MLVQETIDKLLLNPKKLFFIDGLGAVLSAFLLGVALFNFSHFFGIPKKVLGFLAFPPCIFAVYDFYFYLRIKERLGLFLKIIASANLAYCCISLGLAFYHYQMLTHLGWVYIILEIVIVVFLASIELKIATKINSITTH